MAEIRAQFMPEISKEMEELKIAQAKKHETSEILKAANESMKADLNNRFAEICNMFVELRPPPRNPEKPPLGHASSSSAIYNSNPHSPPLPEPPDSRFRDSGPHDLRDWIYRSEMFFSLDGTVNKSKVRLASMHLAGRAMQWHQNYITQRYGVYPSWPDYVMAISTRFGGKNCDPLSELLLIKQDGDSVDDFLEKFECGLTLLDLTPANTLSIFLTNLNPHLTYHTHQFHPTDVSEAAEIARLHEFYLQNPPPKHNRAPFSPS